MFKTNVIRTNGTKLSPKMSLENSTFLLKSVYKILPMFCIKFTQSYGIFAFAKVSHSPKSWENWVKLTPKKHFYIFHIPFSLDFVILTHRILAL